LSAKETREKAEKAGEEQDSIKELKAEYDKKLGEMQSKLDKLLHNGKIAIDDNETVSDLKESINIGHDKMVDVLEAGENLIKEYPTIAVAAVLVVGILLGASLGRKGTN
jgi:ElaB/YqjD/DUF883 family membrane-anchored ribosome-binding protein